MTKRLLHWRGILMGLALFLTLLPVSFRFNNRRITWIFLQDMPAEATALVGLATLACWGCFLYMRRRLQGTGL